MDTNLIRTVLRDESIVTGIILFSGSPMIIELAAAAGIDFVIIDMEHSPIDLTNCSHLIRAAEAYRITPYVRVPETDHSLIMKLLNLGAAGIVIPHATVKNCTAALRAARYAPDGDRGACAIVRSTGYRPGEWGKHIRSANDRVAVIPLLESLDAIQDLDALCMIDGLDVFFVGPTDLSIDLGVPGATFDEPKMSSTLDKIIATARCHGKGVMTTIGNRLEPNYAQNVLARGVRFLVLGTDGHLFLDICLRMNAVKKPLCANKES